MNHSKLLLKQLVLPLAYAVILLTIFLLKLITLEFLVLFLFGSVVSIVILVLDQLYLHNLYREPGLAPQLITRSPIFLLVLVPLSLFVLTSSGSTIGMALILTLWSALFVEMFYLRNDRSSFQTRFLLQVKRTIYQVEVQRLVIAIGVFTAVLHVLALR